MNSSLLHMYIYAIEPDAKSMCTAGVICVWNDGLNESEHVVFSVLYGKDFYKTGL